MIELQNSHFWKSLVLFQSVVLILVFWVTSQGYTTQRWQHILDSLQFGLAGIFVVVGASVILFVGWRSYQVSLEKVYLRDQLQWQRGQLCQLIVDTQTLDRQLAENSDQLHTVLLVNRELLPFSRERLREQVGALQLQRKELCQTLKLLHVESDRLRSLETEYEVLDSPVLKRQYQHLQHRLQAAGISISASDRWHLDSKWLELNAQIELELTKQDLLKERF